MTFKQSSSFDWSLSPKSLLNILSNTLRTSFYFSVIWCLCPVYSPLSSFHQILQLFHYVLWLDQLIYCFGIAPSQMDWPNVIVEIEELFVFFVFRGVKKKISLICTELCMISSESQHFTFEHNSFPETFRVNSFTCFS